MNWNELTQSKSELQPLSDVEVNYPSIAFVESSSFSVADARNNKHVKREWKQYKISTHNTNNYCT